MSFWLEKKVSNVEQNVCTHVDEINQYGLMLFGINNYINVFVAVLDILDSLT